MGLTVNGLRQQQMDKTSQMTFRAGLIILNLFNKVKRLACPLKKYLFYEILTLLISGSTEKQLCRN